MIHTPLPLNHGCHELVYTPEADKLLVLADRIKDLYDRISLLSEPNLNEMEVSGVSTSCIEEKETLEGSSLLLHNAKMSANMTMTPEMFALRLAHAMGDKILLSTLSLDKAWHVDGELVEDYSSGDLIAWLDASLVPSDPLRLETYGVRGILDTFEPSTKDLYYYISDRLTPLAKAFRKSTRYNALGNGIKEYSAIMEMAIGQVQMSTVQSRNGEIMSSTYIEVHTFEPSTEKRFTLLTPSSPMPARAIYSVDNQVRPIENGAQFVSMVEAAFSQFELSL